MKIKMTKSFKRKVVLDGVPYIVEQNHKDNSLKIFLKEDKTRIYAYENGNLDYNYGQRNLVYRIFHIVHVERYPILYSERGSIK